MRGWQLVAQTDLSDGAIPPPRFCRILEKNKRARADEQLLRASILLFLASLAGVASFRRRNLDDACAIVRERPEYYRAMKASERKWGIPIHVQMAAIHQESKFVGNARTPHRFALGIIPMGRQSSAYGFSQALDGTWEEYQDEQGRRSARRDRINDATDFMGWYMYNSTVKLGISQGDAQPVPCLSRRRTGFKCKLWAKGWLVDVADRVGQRSQTYAMQLQACGR